MASDKGTIKIPRDDFERHNERRKDASLTWAEYLDEESVTITYDIDRAAIASDVAAEVVSRLQ